jgi:uncharacterized protein
VLQHQFWDLTVGDDDFSVGLAFNAIPERLHIPFKAVKAFFDPSVQFGLQFVVDGEASGGTDVGTATRAATGKPAAVAASPATLAPPKLPDKEPARQETSPAKPAPVPAADSGDSSAEVVRLDRFRKK